MTTATVPRTVVRTLSRARPLATSRIAPRVATAKPAQRCIHQTSSSASFTSLRHRPSPSYFSARNATRVGAVESRRTMFIQTESTPNPDAMKFNPNTRVLPEDFPSTFLEYMSPRSTLAPPYPSPLAAKLLNVDGVTSVFFGADYITVSKDSSVPWAHVKPEIFSLISEYVASGQPMVNITQGQSEEGQESAEDSLAYNEDDDEIVGMIKELLETRIRPAIQDDGGDIEFRGFQDGIVMLKLRGACRTCDSSTVTLKNGIEQMLVHYLSPDVQGVQHVLDEEEEISMREFAKFEEKLRQQKGPDATASTVGKGSLDYVE
ncbi:HIRA-interacting protein 5 [Macrophomina phaseolina]|uniref:HIRA-interacting protein 5 n=1 Tax=Macrophomina phaseolina TaxID=35725 RepID=A0ABQ8GNC1_9PEZI|nr:HIRA-interacting protein 5 [Macrophomina phaseolina]